MTALERLNIARPYKLTIDDFFALDATGAFENLGKTELIEGEVVFMNAQHRPHARLKSEIGFALRDALKAAASPYSVIYEATVAMPPHNAPEPDLVVTREPVGDGPIPLASVALLVEVADTTLNNDLGLKAAIYAGNGVGEYWVADVRARTLYQFWQPSEVGYAQDDRSSLDSVTAAKTLEDVSIGPFDF